MRKLVVGTLLISFFGVSFAQDSTSDTGFAAVSGERGGQDITGPYNVAADWPKIIATLPGHGEWTWGA